LERVQRTATRLIPQFRKLSYEERLRKLGLTTLKERRQRGDMIEVFKLLEGIENVDCNHYFLYVSNHLLWTALRGHDRKLVKVRSRLDTRKFFFTQRVVNSRNSSPASVVQATSVNMLKNTYEIPYGRNRCLIIRVFNVLLFVQRSFVLMHVHTSVCHWPSYSLFRQ